jgi:hypothetical protein
MKINRLKAVHASLLLSLSLFVIFAGCSKDDDNNPVGPGGGSTTQTILPAQGGTVVFDNASVTIPPGALTDTTDITVAALATAPSFNLPPNTVVMGQVYHFTPDSLTFNQSVEVKFEYTDAQLGAHNESTITIYTFDQPGQTPVALSGLVREPASNQITGETLHFSYFYIGVSTQEGGNYPPPQGGNPIGEWTMNHIDYQLYSPLPDTVQVNITGNGTGTANLTQTNFDLNEYLTAQVQVQVLIFGYWVPYNYTVQDTSHILGTYIVSGDTLLATITASPTDPDLIGNIEHIPYTATTNELTLYRDVEYNLMNLALGAHTWTVFTK